MNDKPMSNLDRANARLNQAFALAMMHDGMTADRAMVIAAHVLIDDLRKELQNKLLAANIL